MIKQYYANYERGHSDLRVNLRTYEIEYLNGSPKDWDETMIDTGDNTHTDGRLKRVGKYLNSGTFCMTYGDGVCDVEVSEIVKFHKSHGKLATVMGVPSPGRFGILEIDGSNKVTAFQEKPSNEVGYINGGFFVLEPGVLDYIEGDATTWERDPLENLARDGELMTYLHKGFWKPMDTLRDKMILEEMIETGNAPWLRVE